jgi:aryl-phospho-beta-D-glucosidase BglC (GH1 family)
LELKRGINFGGWLSQCDHTKERYDTFLGKGDVARVAGWGFDHIRLPFDYNVIEEEEGKEKPAGYTYLDNMVAWCREYKLDLILDLHKAAGYDFSIVGSDKQNTLFNNDALKNDFLALWERLALRYSNDGNVAFELLNEVVEQEAASSWNELIADAVNAIRKHAKDTIIIYGGIQWNSARTLKLLEKPADRNIVYTFHFYEPLIFTHQKAPWVPNIIMDRDIHYPGTMAYYIELSKVLGYKGKDVTDSDAKEMGDKLIKDMVLEAKKVANEAGVQLYCGEFGVIDKAPAQDTLNWFKDVLPIFGENQIGCAIWSYKQMDFGIIDEHYDSIRDSLIKLYAK